MSTLKLYWAPVLVGLAAFVFQVLALESHVNTYDEGIVLTGAFIVHSGGVLYRDFWVMYGPAQFYVSALLFALFDVSAAWPRGIGLLAKSAIVALGYVVVARMATRPIAILVAMLVTCVLVYVRLDVFPVFPATALTLASILCLDRGRYQSPSYLFVAGMLTGLATTFRHDLGTYAAMAALVAIGLRSAQAEGEAQGMGAASRRAASRAAAYLGGLAAVTVPVAAYFLAKVPVALLYECLFAIPSTVYPTARGLPWPGWADMFRLVEHPLAVNGLVVYLPLLICGSAIVVWLRSSFSRGGNGLLALLVAMTGLLFMLKGAVRVSIHHMAPALVVSVLLLPWLFGQLRSVGPLPRLAVFAFGAVCAVLFLPMGIQSIAYAQINAIDLRHAERNLLSRCRAPVLPWLRCLDMSIPHLAAARFITAHSATDDRIFVAAGRHDKLFANAMDFYFASQRLPATRWSELHPGVQTQVGIQRQIIADLEANLPRYVVVDPTWDTYSERNQSAVSSGVVLLDEYLDKRYSTVVASAGGLEIRVRSDGR